MKNRKRKYLTVFPHIVSAETILFWIWKSKGYSKQGQRSQYINVQKLFKGGNYMRKYGNCILIILRSCQKMTICFRINLYFLIVKALPHQVLIFNHSQTPMDRIPKPLSRPRKQQHCYHCCFLIWHSGQGFSSTMVGEVAKY